MTPQTNTDKVKEETADEAAVRIFPRQIQGYEGCREHGFIIGANWQASKMYSPSEVQTIINEVKDRCAEAARLRLLNMVTGEDDIHRLYHTMIGEIIPDKQSILSIDYSDLLNKYKDGYINR